ncbi:MAG: DNA polymerase III subunit delta [Candidatus Thiodiazotropha sp.]|jgi:DNA polymerase III subunit delta
MRLRNDQLPAQLKRTLAPIYLLSGDEPLQMKEAADQIRQTAREQGFTEREVLDQGIGFDWSALNVAAESLSLFGDKRILELRLTSAKVGAEGGKALTAYCQRPAEDTLLLLILPKLEKVQMNSKWLQAIDRSGVVIQVWPVEGGRLIPWIEQRLRNAGLLPSQGVVEMLADRVEGNLLAASQEIEKLLLLQGEGLITTDQLVQAVADSSRFDVFGLLDTLLAGDAAKGLRMLAALKAEAVASPIVLWALSREIRALAEMAYELEQGQNIAQVMSRFRVWEKRKPLIKKALMSGKSAHWRHLLVRCAEADQAIKGITRSDPWLLLQGIVQGVSGFTPL